MTCKNFKSYDLHMKEFLKASSNIFTCHQSVLLNSSASSSWSLLFLKLKFMETCSIFNLLSNTINFRSILFFLLFLLNF